MYQWRDYTGSLPLDALHFNGLYVAQVYYKGFLPSTLYPQKREAWTVYNGEKVIMKQGIKVLNVIDSNNLIVYIFLYPRLN